MENPRPQKVAVVTEVRERLDAAEAAILTEYRGLTVAELAALRRALRAAGGDYKVYKNTLVKLAISGGRHEALAPLLEGPTAIAFVAGEVSAAAKALRDYARTYPSLVIKGGLHGEGFLSAPGAERPRRPAASRRAPGPAGRGHRRAAPAVRRPPAGASPQPRLRAVGPARRAGRRSRRDGRSRGDARGRAERRGRASSRRRAERRGRADRRGRARGRDSPAEAETIAEAPAGRATAEAAPGDRRPPRPPPKPRRPSPPRPSHRRRAEADAAAPAEADPAEG